MSLVKNYVCDRQFRWGTWIMRFNVDGVSESEKNEIGEGWKGNGTYTVKVNTNGLIYDLKIKDNNYEITFNDNYDSFKSVKRSNGAIEYAIKYLHNRLTPIKFNWGSSIIRFNVDGVAEETTENNVNGRREIRYGKYVIDTASSNGQVYNLKMYYANYRIIFNEYFDSFRSVSESGIIDATKYNGSHYYYYPMKEVNGFQFRVGSDPTERST